MANKHYVSGFDGFDRMAQSHCAVCEATLADALDGTLDPAEQALFDRHLNSCTRCTDLFAEAQRGVAWLELLKTPRPAPRPELLASILAQTSGSTLAQTLPLHAAAYSHATLPEAARILAFAPRPTPMHRLSRILLEPRLAMTAAMAFLSITLTMSLTGVRLKDVHASDLSPSALRRTAHGMQAGAVRYYDNLRVVHVLESRVDDLRDNLQQRRQDEMPATPTPPSTLEPVKPAKQQAFPDRGTSSIRPQSDETFPVLGSMVALLNPCTMNGDRA